MSKYHLEELVDFGIKRNQLTYVLPALDDTQVRRIHFTIQGNRYRDGRKNEAFLKQLANEVDLTFAEFSFFGTGWQEIADILREAGGVVAIHPPGVDFDQDYVHMIDALKIADYYLNMGWDEGSLGSLDAFVNRTKMIVSAQGYHLHMSDESVEYFNDYSEFRNIFETIRIRQVQRQIIANNMSWKQYAKNHQGIWESILRGEALPMPQHPSYIDGPQTFDRAMLNPILDTSFRKTLRRGSGILLRKLRIDKA
jgi:hypothetical protein